MQHAKLCKVPTCAKCKIVQGAKFCHISIKPIFCKGSPNENKLASLEATLVRNYDRVTDLLPGVKCRATSVAKNLNRFCVAGFQSVIV